MAHWETITRALHSKGGGPLQRGEFDFDVEIESDESVRVGLRRAQEHGLVAAHGAYGAVTWTLTQRGWDWCDGLVVIAVKSWRRRPWQPNGETESERQARLNRLSASSADAFAACSRLTNYQIETLRLIAKGFTHDEISKIAGVKHHIVTTRMIGILAALGCTRSIEAAVIAAKAGIA